MTTSSAKTSTNCGRRSHNSGYTVKVAVFSKFEVKSQQRGVKQRRESYLCSPNRGAVSDVCGHWIEGLLYGDRHTLAGSATSALCCAGWVLTGGSRLQEFH